MGCCTGRCFLITLCVLQFVATVERQVFDFLGYMWAPIIGNFLQIIFVIVGFFGTLQYRPKVLIAYTVWSVVWIGWNIFVICYYLELGILNREMSILNLGTGNKSWWLDNGIGCTLVNQTSSTSFGSSGDSLTRRDVPSEGDVSGCLLQYYYVEVVHAGVQCFLGLLGFCVACYVVCVFTEEDDSFDFIGGFDTFSSYHSPNKAASHMQLQPVYVPSVVAQPVHDELEYIKMRYRSPARSSFRTNKAYETLTTRSTYTTSSTLERGFENNYSDDSADRYLDKKGDKKRVLKDGGGRDVGRGDVAWIQGPGIVDPVTGQTQIQSQHHMLPSPDVAFNISGQTPGLTIV